MEIRSVHFGQMHFGRLIKHSVLRTGLAGLMTAAGLAATSAHASEALAGGKLILTNGATSVEGSSGGGLASWAVIAGNETDKGIGISAHVTAVVLPDYRLETHGVAIGIADRIELSYARQNFDTGEVGRALGLGQGFTFNQDIYGVKVRLFGDVVYGPSALPQVSIGIQHKRNLDRPIVTAVGAASAEGTDFILSATKLDLKRSVLFSAALRLTNANQFGLLGFGTPGRAARSVQFEGSIAYMLSPKLVVGAEARTKPNRLAIAKENAASDLFAAYALNRNLTFTAAYADLGAIATFEGQRGAYLSIQAAF